MSSNYLQRHLVKFKKPFNIAAKMEVKTIAILFQFATYNLN